MLAVAVLLVLGLFGRSFEQDFLINPTVLPSTDPNINPYAAFKFNNFPRYIQPNQFIRMDQALKLVADNQLEAETVSADPDPFAPIQQRFPQVNGRWNVASNPATFSKYLARQSLAVNPNTPYYETPEWDTPPAPVAAVEDVKQQPRLFSLFGFLSTPVLTVYSFVATRLTSTSTKYCLKSLNYGGVTACGRKRRSSSDLSEEEELFRQAIEPSPTNQAMVSAPPTEAFQTPGINNNGPILASSMSDSSDQSSWPSGYPQPRRAARFRAYYISTTTIRIPTVTIRYTTTVKTIQLVADANSAQLTCLPMGLKICGQEI